jgi:acyl carrier protein
MTPLEEKVKELFAVMLRESPEGITDATRPADLARWDSLQHLILVSGFEEEFNLDIDPDEVVEMYNDFRTFKSVVLKKMEGAA